MLVFNKHYKVPPSPPQFVYSPCGMCGGTNHADGSCTTFSKHLAKAEDREQVTNYIDKLKQKRGQKHGQISRSF